MKPENPYAFPTFERVDQWDKDDEKYRESMLPTGGMTLRDYFAAKAMQGLIGSNDDGAGDRLTEIPGYAYAIADEMLKERAK